MRCPNFLKNILTEGDNQTFCPVRLIALLGAFEHLGLEFYTIVIRHAVFDPQGFAIGLGALVGGIGVALGLKKERGSNNDSSTSTSASGDSSK